MVALLGAGTQALTRGGAAIASLVGGLILWQTGWPGAAVLAAFFIPASLVSRLVPDPGDALGAKGSSRDSLQVLANGGPAAIGVLMEELHPGSGMWILAGSLAAAAADTWATSLGGLSKTDPRSVLTWRPVRPGTSGGVTLLGTIAALPGAGLVALPAGLLAGSQRLIAIATGIGVLGMFLDSYLGAALQGKFHCPSCDAPVERAVHSCGTRAVRVGGLPGLTNDGVNLATTTLSAYAGWLAWQYLR